MVTLQIILTVLSLGTLLLSVTKPQYGVWCYLVYMYLAPYLYIGGFIVYARTLAFVFLALFLWKYGNKLKKKDYAPFKAYMIFLAWCFISVLLSEQIEYSFNGWITACSALFFIFFLYGNMITYPQMVNVYKWTLFGVFGLITLYGIFLTTIPGVNPYKIIEQPLFGQEFNEAYALGNSGLNNGMVLELSEGRVFGRISSVFDHPMAYGLNLGFFFLYSLYILKNKPKIMIITLSVIVWAIITSGTRTPIGALGLTVLAMLFYLKKFKYFIGGAFCFLALYYTLPLISSELNDYVMSIFNSNDSNTNGSSIDMRLSQLEGSFNIVEDNDNILFGQGYLWDKWYNSTHGTHPTVLWFESIIFTILVDTGIFGFVLWFFFIRGIIVM